MKHSHFEGKKNSEEIIKEKAWYIASLIVIATIKIFEIITKKISENQSYYGVELLNTREISKSHAEIQLLLAGFSDHVAREILPERVSRVFSEELLKKLASLAGNMKEEYDLTYEEYLNLGMERFKWHKEINNGVEFKYESLPSGDTHKIICTQLFGIYNDELFYLFEKTFGEIMLNMDIENVIKEH